MKKLKLYSIAGIVAIVLFFSGMGQRAQAQIREVHLIINIKPNVNFGAAESTSTPLTLDFIDSTTISQGNIVAWKWKFGDGDSSLFQNPTHTYAASGFYNVTLTSYSQAGCESSVTKTVLVEDKTNIGIVVNNPVQCSLGNSFTYAGTGVPSNSIYEWDFGDGSSVSNETNPTHNYATSGAYTVRLIVSESAPSTIKDTAFLNVTVVPVPNVNGLNVVYCSGEQVPVYYFTGSLPGTTYQWNRLLGQDFSIGLAQTSGTDSMPSFTAQNTGIQFLTQNYSVTPYYTANGATCAGQEQNFSITVNPNPQLTDIGDLMYNNGQLVNAYPFTGNIPDAQYAWHYVSGNILENLPATGNNQIPAFAAINTGTSALTALYEAVPSYTHDGKTCVGEAKMFSITVLPNGSVTFDGRAQICISEPEVLFLCQSNDTAAVLYHKIVFGQKALDAGFTNMNDFSLLTESFIRIAMPTGVQAGQYTGSLLIKTGNSENYDTYDFAIDVIQPTRLIQKSEARIEICNTNAFIHLEVEAEGENLGYQWFRNGIAIDNATTAVYEKTNAGSADFGDYSIAITGDCGTITSFVASVEPTAAEIMQKWNDMVFVSNRDSLGNKRQITAYQWYRVSENGSLTAITDKGQSQYYSEPGMQGTFAVEVTFADGGTKMTCPYTINQVKQAVIKVYPNPGQANEKINVLLDLADNKPEGSTIEVFDELGKLIAKKTATSNTTEFYLNVPSATYIFRITEPSGHVTNQKVIIK